MHYLSRKREERSWRRSEIIRATSLLLKNVATASVSIAQRPLTESLRAGPFWRDWGAGTNWQSFGGAILTQQSHGHRTITLIGSEGKATTPVGLEGGTLSKRGLFWTLRSHGIGLARFWTCLEPVLFSSFWFLSFGMECLSYAFLIIVFWKHIAYLVSQANSWRGTFP